MSATNPPRPGVVLVDNDAHQLENLAQVFRMSGFSVLAFGCPVVALSFLARGPAPPPEVAVLDYQMPRMAGSVLAQYLKARYPKLKIVLYSGSPVIPANDLSHVDTFVPKGSGVARLLQEIAQLRDS